MHGNGEVALVDDMDMEQDGQLPLKGDGTAEKGQMQLLGVPEAARVGLGRLQRDS